MNKIRIIILASIMGATSVTTQAQTYHRTRHLSNYRTHADSVIANFSKGLADIRYSVANDSADVSFNPYMYRITNPNTYYSQSLRNQFDIDWTPSRTDTIPATTSGMDYRNSLNSMIDKALVDAYMTRSHNFTHYDSQFDDVEVLADERPGIKKEEIQAILESAPVIDDVSKVIDTQTIDITPERPNFWKKSGKFTTQFTQSYFSENWYQGGSNNVTLLSTLLLEANYNDQKRVQWDNKADFRLGFVTTPEDEMRGYMTSSDKIYLMTKLGIKAAKSWYYTIQAEVNSQFLPGHKKGRVETFSRFLSPLDVYVSIGMDYKPTLKKGTFSAALLPLTYKLRYIHDREEDVFDANDPEKHIYPIHNNFSMMEDGLPIDTKHDFGSKVELNAKIEIVKNLTWRSRFYYFTTYKYVESELENALSFQFNKYLSTEVNARWRFDDNRSPSTKDDKLGYFQFKEYFTFGLSYNF